MQAFIKKLERKLTSKENRLAQLQRILNKPDPKAECFPLGVGFDNALYTKKGAQALDRFIRQNKESLEVRAEVAQLKNQIDGLKSGRYNKQGREIYTAERLQELINAAKLLLAKGAINWPLSQEEINNIKDLIKTNKRRLAHLNKDSKEKIVVSKTTQQQSETTSYQDNPLSPIIAAEASIIVNNADADIEVEIRVVDKSKNLGYFSIKEPIKRLADNSVLIGEGENPDHVWPTEILEGQWRLYKVKCNDPNCQFFHEVYIRDPFNPPW